MSDDIYPYEKSSKYHEHSYAFFNIPGVAKMDIESADTIAKHIFGKLGCGAPGSDHPALIKYDALGGSGGPWESGIWINADKDRASVTSTIPEVDITAMTSEQRAAYLAELQAMVRAADDADRAGANQHRDNEEVA